MSSPREIRRQAKALIKLADRAAAANPIDMDSYWVVHGMVRMEATDAKLTAMPVEALEPVAASPARLAALREVGIATVADAMYKPGYRLRRAKGVGETTSSEVKFAAKEVWEAVLFSTNARFTPDAPSNDQTELLGMLSRRVERDRALRGLAEPVAEFARDAIPLVRAALPAANPLVSLFSGAARRDRATAAINDLEGMLTPLVTRDTPRQLADRLKSIRGVRLKGDALWADFRLHPQEYYAAMDQIGQPVLRPTSEGAIPAELVAKVASQRLDTTHLRATLRRYQEFGAKFALAQKRAMIGDEMGLGKTIQAIAVMAHLQSQGAGHFLVVAPASVLINWEREVRQHSDLEPFRIHGADRAEALADWVARGGVAVTTYETLRMTPLPPGVVIDLFVVDEAHYVKNSDAGRSKTVRDLASRTDRVLFLTGTPMENRVSEFQSLVEILQPKTAEELTGYGAVAGADAFRMEVAPVYLRRNQDEVLTELPEMIQVDEWELLSSRETAAYRQEVRGGNFMQMRQATFGLDALPSTKLERLVDICAEARASGDKILVYSYFRATLAAVADALGEACIGLITGDVPPVARQRLVDEFTAAEAPVALVAQIQAGGVGLNLQAASVVILCEPQIKPTLETQAIARAYRMGQLRRVQVHRLLAPDTVDETMVDMLGHKAALFDAYARPSALSDAAASEQDLAGTEGDDESLVSRIVATERARLVEEEPSLDPALPA